MGIKKHTYVMTGICRTRQQLDDLSINIFENDLFLPLIEGDEGDNETPLRIQYGEGSDFYIGRVIAKSYADEDSDFQEIQFPSHHEVASELNAYGFGVTPYDIRNFMVSVWR